MKKAVFIPLTIALGLLATNPVFAKTTVEISNNGEGSTSDVKINNSVKINGNSKNTDSETSVKITTNGETKEYTTKGDEDINIQSSDGTSRVQINNNSSSTNSSSVKSANDESEDKEDKSKEDKSEKKEDANIEEKVSFFENPIEFLKSLLMFWEK